jgi:aminocarboxymuconate-semialdehyde decarboxylase
VIDIHNHFIPPWFAEDARRGIALDDVVVESRDGQEWMIHGDTGRGYPLAAEFWDMEAKLKHMDGLGIDISVLSIAPPLVFYWLDPNVATEFCQRTNESLAKASQQSGGRLYGMATLPMQDPEAAVIELNRAVNDLGLVGAMIGTTIEKVPLDDPRFEEVLANVSELGVPLLLHPYDRLVGKRSELTEFYLTNLIGIPLATTLAASRLILTGTLERHPNLTIVLMHAGGYLPYQIGRLDHGHRVRAETKSMLADPPSNYLRRFYLDTITHSPDRLESLIGWVGADRIVLGTDIPFDMADLSFKEKFKDAGLDEKTVFQISNGNAKRILGLDD